MITPKQQGFTLIEVAIVFVIIAALLSAVFMPLSAQKQSKYINTSKSDLLRIEEAIYGYTSVNGRMPCPAMPGSGGAESPLNTATTCTSNHGFVPSNTLGVSGSVNCDGLLLDPWGQPYRYSITSIDSAAFGTGGVQDYVNAAELQAITVLNLGNGGNLQVCWNLNEDCTAGSTASNVLINNAIAVLYSTGKPRSTSNLDEDQNAGEGAPLASSCGLASYEMPNNNYFYSADRREIENQEFDDIMIYISVNTLIAKWLQSGIF